MQLPQGWLHGCAPHAVNAVWAKHFFTGAQCAVRVAKDLFSKKQMSKQVAKSHGVVQASVAFCVSAPKPSRHHASHRKASITARNCTKHGQSKTINKIFICHGAAYRLLCLSLHFKQYYNN